MNTKTLLNVLAEELIAWPEPSHGVKNTFSDYFWCDMDGEVRYSANASKDFYPKSHVKMTDRGNVRILRGSWADARTLFLFRKFRKHVDEVSAAE